MVEEGVTGAELEHVAGQFPKINSLNEFKEMKYNYGLSHNYCLIGCNNLNELNRQ